CQTQPPTPAAQWALAAGVGGWVWHALSPSTEVTGRTVAVTVLALAVVGAVNQTAFTVVLSIVNRSSLPAQLRKLAPIILPGWVIGWAVNSLIGLLYVLAIDGHPLASLLFIVPLAVLFFAYRGYAGTRSDRVRLAGLHRAARALAEPLDPREAIGAYLREVATCFEAVAAELVLRSAEGRIVHRYVASTGGHTVEIQPDDTVTLEGMLLDRGEPARVAAKERGEARDALVSAGWRECLAAPLTDDDEVSGVLIVLDQAGFEGFEAGELAVIEALARETAVTFTKGSLFAEILEERRKLAEIVSTTSDGILTIGEDGRVRSWNEAMAEISGLPASEVVDAATAIDVLDPRTAEGERVRPELWTDGRKLPSELRITRPDGTTRTLSCSYSFALDPEGTARTLVVVARDITSEEEIDRLREEFGRLAEAERAQRAIVEQLQQAVMPKRPTVPDLELAVSYIASDPSAPTGGDLYDWQVLPSGHLHVAVVDVLGHGVAATRDALAVVHALRLLALQECPIDEIVARADELMRAESPGLAASVLVLRYDPRSGLVQLVSGGHPPALHVSPEGVRQIPASGGVIGWPGAGSDDVVRFTLGPSESLVLYTDGLVEARKDILEGTERLMEQAACVASASTDEMPALLVEGCLQGAERRDDSLALVLRRAPGEHRAVWRYIPSRETVRVARSNLSEWLSAQQVSPERLQDALLCVSELVSNSVRFARSSVVLAADVVDSSIVLEVSDDGTGDGALVTRGTDRPDPLAVTGRGLFIVRSLSREVDIRSDGTGTVVRAVIATGQPASAQTAGAEAPVAADPT
ncbi:MAG TPA: SpoIIE family protein phosphatase, partial [Actinomycetota bacterium]|nr:SpoIIE family protein phosphatase [Actinomycetota bacterium]